MSSTRTGGPCPKCQGKGRIDEFGIGLVVVCTECAGALAEHQPNREDHQDAAIWTHPAVSSLDVCHVCLGTRVIVNLGGTGEPTGHVIEMPCPACGEPDDEDYQA